MTNLKIEIIYQDKDIVLINKPAGVVVNNAASVKGETVQSWAKPRLEKWQSEADEWQSLVPDDFDSEYGTPEEIFTDRLGMVHRLDKNTSGILLLAKNPGSLVNLLAQFRNREVQKKYLCLVHNQFDLMASSVKAPLARAQKDRKKFAVDPTGRPALTYYKVKQAYSDLDWEKIRSLFENEADFKKYKKSGKSYQQGFSFVECYPKTGRTHQIRVHMAHIHHPLVGDTTYVGKKRAKLDPVWCPRHFLHASEIKIVHPRKKTEESFKVGLTKDLIRVLDLLCPKNI